MHKNFSVRVNMLKIDLDIIWGFFLLDKECNPSVQEMLGLDDGNKTVSVENNSITVDYKSLLSLVIFLVCVLYAR